MPSREPTFLFEIGAAPALKDASGIRMRLLEAIDQNRRILVDVTKLEQCDLSLVQLLIAAGREATKRGQHFSLAEPPSGVLLQSLNQIGLLNAAGEPACPEDAEVWFGNSKSGSK